MTREDAIKMLKYNSNVIHKNINGDTDPKEVEALDMAIKALEQEPCEDAVSRKDVIDHLHTNMAWYDENGSIADDSQKLRDITNLVNGIPPVTPTRKKGKWIKEKTIHGWDGFSYQCSECGRSIHLDTEVEDLMDYPYCHCGAEMESEE